MRRAVEDDVINDCFEKMLKADAILLGSSTYFAYVSAGMKALIERCGMVSKANGIALKRKLGASVVATRLEHQDWARPRGDHERWRSEP